MEMGAIEELLKSAAGVDKHANNIACELLDEGIVRLIDSANASEIGPALTYHLGSEDGRYINRDLRKERCALLDRNLMPLGNGVVLDETHGDLKCSHQACDFNVCPVALAACLIALQGEKGVCDSELYRQNEREKTRIGREVSEFREKWKSRLSMSDEAINLLLGTHENDFAGMLIVDDTAYQSDFIEDLARMLHILGKIETSNAETLHMMELAGRADPSKGRFRTTGDENLKAKSLYVLDKLSEFVNDKSLFGNSQKDYVIERLSHIVDDRYVLIVGTEEETRAFTNLDSRLLLTFDQNKIYLEGMPLEVLYGYYLEDLEPRLRAEAIQSADFEEEFKQFVGFNMDCMPFRGEELADYLAKHANARDNLVLPTSRYQSSSLDEMLDGVIGLSQVKSTIRQLEQYAVFRREAIASKREMPNANMHMLFLGNPGTGKTMVARIIATMLYKIGIIRQNKCIEVTSKDLIAGYVGQTDKKTAEVIQSAIGGILFIDEAYALASGGEGSAGDYGRESVAELVKSMEDYRDDLIVIFAGYEKEMDEFIELNSGLASRIGYTFRFEDYSTEELIEIFKRGVAKAGFEYDERQIDYELADLFDYYRRFKNFGNGRFVSEVLQKAIIKHAVSNEGKRTDYLLRVDDIPTKQELFNMAEWAPQSADEHLADLVGMDDLKSKVREFEKIVEYREQARTRGLKLPRNNMHMVFTGNPGTGKTTVARIIATVLYNVGIVPTNKFIEVEANDLSAFQFRSSETAVEKTLRDAMGGVLFIDEAYSLLFTRGGDEIISNIVKAMEEHKGELVVMFAGYEREMREFLDRNPGLSSRIGYGFHFDDYETDELVEILVRKVEKTGLKLNEGTVSAARDVLRYFHGTENYGNGRFVDKLLQEMIAKHSNQYNAESFGELGPEDVPSISEMCKLVSMPVYEPSDISGDDARRRVALHEMGHAICRLALTGGTDIVVVTIEQEGNGALGYVQHKNSATALPTSEDLEKQIVELMGGMAAEELAYGAYSCGNSSDLQQATAIASNYVARYGMSSAGYVQYLGDVKRGQQPVALVDLPDGVLDQIDNLMAKAFERAKSVIEENRRAYDQLVDVLLKESTITGDRITKLWTELQEADCNG